MNPNQFTSVTRTGFGSRIMSAIIGVPVGIILIFGSCVLLYWNEGRTDYSKIAKKSVVVQAQQVDQSQNGNFVSVTGSVTGQKIGDGSYLAPASNVAVQRIVEEYAWVEHSQTSSNNNTGGSQTNTTTYTYDQEWIDSVPSSSDFKHPEGHQNTAKPVDDTLVKASSGKVGAYSFDPQTIKLPGLQGVNLSSTNTILPKPVTTPVAAAATPAQATPATSTTTPAAVNPTVSPVATATTTNVLSNISLANSQYLYGGNGTISSPQNGDIRISYKALPTGSNVTVFGKLNNGNLDAYTDSNNHTLYDLLNGDRQTAIATLHGQYETMLWIFRGVGLVLIWVGLMMVLAPLDVLLDFLPIVGAVGGALSLLITFPIALALGGTAILVGYTMHHVFALLIAIPVVFGIFVGVLKLIKKTRGLPSKKGGAQAGSSAQPNNPVSPPAGGDSGGSLFPAAGTPAPVTASSPVVTPAPTAVAATVPATAPVTIVPTQPLQPQQPVQPQPQTDNNVQNPPQQQ